jgi:predicted TIM-barrel fold metal-dependent hydrolase
VRVIDTHAHVFPDSIAAKAVAALAAEGGITPYYDGTVSGLLSAMDRGGVTCSVIVPVATKPSQVRTINDWVGTLGSDRILPFGAMHPDFPDPASEIARMATLGIRGIKLHSQHQHFMPDEERMSPIYDAAEREGLVVLFHAGGYVVDRESEAGPAEFARMLDAHPGLRCVLAHMGGYRRWDEVRELLCGRDVYFDTAYVPRNLADEAFLALARDHGIERVLFGTDGPWADAAEEIAYLGGMGFTAAELDAILYGNAARLYGLE